MSLRARAFSPTSLWDEVRSASGSACDDPTDHVRYLASYLRKSSPPARTMVVEKPYVDRHYLEEFTGYYASKLKPPSSKTTRIHFFSSAFDDAGLRAVTARGGTDYENVRHDLESKYLGFVVVRPFASAALGRTVLRPYSDKPSRHFQPAKGVSRVHLAGVELELRGLAFQQQDQGVGACATAALWSALACVMRNDGARPATPFAVTRAATKHVLSSRAFPASGGLDLTQMLAAISELGYSPHVLKPGEGADVDKFLIAVQCYLRSGIPVVMQVKAADDEGHAVACVGFRASDDEETVNDLSCPTPHGFELRAHGMSRVYIHDDRLGPYARAKWLRRAIKGGAQQLWLKIDPYERGFDKFEAPALVRQAIVPLYPKLRLTAEDLAGYASELLPLARHLAGAQRDSLKTTLRFALSGRYLTDVLSLGLTSSRTWAAVARCELSRYVGVVEFAAADEWLLQAVFDTTDIRRESSEPMPILMLVCKDAAIKPALAEAAKKLYAGALVV